MPKEIPEFDLDLAPKKLARVAVKGQKCVLVEASDAAVTAWRAANMQATRVEGGEVTGLGMDELADARLLAECLREAEFGKQTFVAAEISKWPASQVAPLIKLLKEGSGMMLPDAEKEDEEDEAERAEKLAEAGEEGGAEKNDEATG